MWNEHQFEKDKMEWNGTKQNKTENTTGMGEGKTQISHYSIGKYRVTIENKITAHKYITTE